MADAKFIKLNANGEFQKHDQTNDSIQVKSITLNDAVTAPITISYTGVITNLNADKVGSKSESDFVLKDGTRSLTANWSIGAYKISTTAETFNDTDLVTKSYVDGAVGSGDFFETITFSDLSQVSATDNGGDLAFTSSDNSLSITSYLPAGADFHIAATFAGAGLGLTTGVLNIGVDDTTVEINGSNQVAIKADGIGSSQIADNAIDTEHLADDAVGSAEIDWAAAGVAPADNKIGAASIPVSSTWTGSATDVDAALEELHGDLGDYLPLAGGTMSGDIDMDGNDITNIGNTSLEFASGAKIIANNFDASGNFILEHEVDDSTLEWATIPGNSGFANFDDGTDGNDIVSVRYQGDGSDPTYSWRQYYMAEIPQTSPKYELTNAHGGTGLSAYASSGGTIMVTKVTSNSVGTYTIVGYARVGSGPTSTLKLYFGSQSVTNSSYHWALKLEGDTANVDLKFGPTLGETTVQDVATVDTWFKFEVAVDHTADTATIEIDDVIKINAMAITDATIQGLFVEFGSSTYLDDLTLTDFTPTSDQSYIRAKDLGISTAKIAADAVGSAEINWGSTGNQVAADDVPVVDSGDRFAAETVEAALAEIYDSMTGDYLPLAGGTMSGDINMDSNSITNLADGANPGDAVNYGQLQAVAAVSKIWKEVLFISDQLLDGASGGIYSAQVVTANISSDNLQVGDIVTLYDGTTTENYEAGGTGSNINFSIGANISATLSNLSTAINANNVTISTTSTLLDSIDPTNDVLILWQDTIGQSTRIYGNAGAATRLRIADPTMTNLYEAISSDLVALPSSQPGSSNFGFSRAYASLELHETHYCRVCDSQFTWDADSNTWQQTGASSIPYASTTDWGKVKIDTDGALDVASGVIGVNVDGSTIIINASNEIEVDSTNIINTSKGLGETSNAIEVKLTTDGGLDFDGSGDIQVDVTDFIDTNYGLTEDTNNIRVKLESDGGIQFDSVNKGLEVKLDGTTLSVGSSGLKVNASGITNTEMADDAVGEAEINWGTGVNLVDATSLPLDTGGTYGGSALNVQDALEEIEGSIPTVYSFKTISDGTNTAVADSDDDTLTFTSTDGSIDIVVSDTPEIVDIELGASVAGDGIALTTGVLSVKTDDTTIQVNLSGELEVIGTFASYAFKTISVSGQSSVVADAADDTLTIAAGSAITVTTDAEADSVTFAVNYSSLAGLTLDKEGKLAVNTSSGIAVDAKTGSLSIACDDGSIGILTNSIKLVTDSVGGANIARSINVDSTNGVGVKVDDSTIEENGSNQLSVKFNDSGTGSTDVWSAQQIARDGLMALTSGSALAIGDIVALNESGKIVKSQAYVGEGYYYETLGIATTAATGADEIVYVKFDRMFTKTGLLTSIGSVGDVIYVSDATAGAYTATEPSAASTVVKRVGIKLSDNDLIVSFGPTILN